MNFRLDDFIKEFNYWNAKSNHFAKLPFSLSHKFQNCAIYFNCLIYQMVQKRIFAP